MKSILFLAGIFLTAFLNAQNLFPVKLNNCKVEEFCLDCGDVKAGYDEIGFATLISELNASLDLKGVSGSIKFQVLIDAKGQGCVLSHTDETECVISRTIVKKLNAFEQWTPAKTKDKIEQRSSITLLFVIKDNKITGQIERIDMAAFKKSFDRPVDPEIANAEYNYTNEHLKNYTISIWNSSNSTLPNNMNDDIAIDQNGLIWLTIDEGLVTFDGESFKRTEQDITEIGKIFNYKAVAVDNNNVTWVNGKGNTYSYENGVWTLYDTIQTGFNWAYSIINNPVSGEIYFCSDDGLTILKNDEWIHINMTNNERLPSNRVFYAKKDSKNRIWIGTFSGSIMIDENGNTTSFNETDNILNKKCITSVAEDESGNLYFSLYDISEKNKKPEYKDEGIAVLYADGLWKQFTTSNSGLSFNHTNCVLYDKIENVLWISTERAGLVRFDLKDGWENYHNLNSDIPTSFISTMTFDKNGVLYLATRQGLVKVERK